MKIVDDLWHKKLVYMLISRVPYYIILFLVRNGEPAN